MNYTMQLDDFAMLLILTMTEQMIALRKWEDQNGMKLYFTVSSSLPTKYDSERQQISTAGGVTP